MPALVADFVDVKSAIAEEASLTPGVYEVRFYLSEPVSNQDIADTRAYLKEQGVEVRGVYQRKTDGLWYMGIKYARRPVSNAIGFLPVMVIPLIAFLFTGLLVGVGIFKLEDITNNIAKLLLITLGGTIVLAAVLRKPLERAVERF